MSKAESAIRALLCERGHGKTICPSEAAREMAGPDGDWRARMSDVHEATARLCDAGAIRLSWKGKSKTAPDGPYRIGLPR
ncbi:MAG: DUF3253 domain-containing protein [Alteraurantiacibacter sp.]